MFRLIYNCHAGYKNLLSQYFQSQYRHGCHSLWASLNATVYALALLIPLQPLKNQNVPNKKGKLHYTLDLDELSIQVKQSLLTYIV